MQDCISSNKIKENKYKILRMSLILGSDDNREETINNFEEAAREIDAMNDEIYLKDLETKFFDTLKLEEEEKKLADLVDYIGGRVEQRISLLSDFANITGYDLTNLIPIKYYDKLDDYKERLKYIREYLRNTEQIETLEKEVKEAEQELKESYINKATAEECNGRNEEILLNKFKNIIKTIPEFKDITSDNLENKLSEVIINVDESKKSLDIFTKSFNALSGAGISYEEELEYRSYVDNAKDLFNKNKEKEYILKLYECLLTKETEYISILAKREQINDILCERLDLKRDLGIDEIDILSPLYDLIERQYNDLEKQRNNIDNIDYLSKSIENKKEMLTELEQANQKVEILSLLREFCIIDTYNDIEEPSDIEPSLELENNINENTLIEAIPTLNNTEITTEAEIKIEGPYEDNQVISIKNATNIDIELIQSKANKVMKRVGEMLGIKVEETKIVNVVNNENNIEELSTNIEEQKLPEASSPEEKMDLPQMENPLFGSNEVTNNIVENNTEQQNNQPEVPFFEENNFWFTSDTPDALNELPDLPNTNENNFFANTPIPDLNFPDLKLDFGNNDLEEK